MEKSGAIKYSDYQLMYNKKPKKGYRILAFDDNGKEADNKVHAEAKIVGYLLITQVPAAKFPYIGISKSCCYNCHHMMGAVESYLGSKKIISHRGDHDIPFSYTKPIFLHFSNIDTESQKKGTIGLESEMGKTSRNLSEKNKGYSSEGIKINFEDFNKLGRRGKEAYLYIDNEIAKKISEKYVELITSNPIQTRDKKVKVVKHQYNYSASSEEEISEVINDSQLNLNALLTQAQYGALSTKDIELLQVILKIAQEKNQEQEPKELKVNLKRKREEGTEYQQDYNKKTRLSPFGVEDKSNYISAKDELLPRLVEEKETKVLKTDEAPLISMPTRSDHSSLRQSAQVLLKPITNAQTLEADVINNQKSERARGAFAYKSNTDKKQTTKRIKREGPSLLDENLKKKVEVISPTLQSHIISNPKILSKGNKLSTRSNSRTK